MRSLLSFLAIAAWLAFSASVLHAQAEPPAEPEEPAAAEAPAGEGSEVQERDIKILGCTLYPMDINRTVRCVQGKIDSEVDKTRRALNQQINSLQGDLNRARADLERAQRDAQGQIDSEVAKARAALNQEINKLQADLNKAQADLDRAQRDFQRQAGALFAALDPATLGQLNLEPLVQCLAQTPADLQRLVTDFAGDPARFAQTEFEVLWRIAAQHMDRMMRNQLQALGRGSVNASIASLVNEADRMMTELAAQRASSRCLWQAIAPQRAQARQIAVQIYPSVDRQMKQLMAQHVQPAIFGAVTDHLGRVLAQATGSPPPPRQPAPPPTATPRPPAPRPSATPSPAPAPARTPARVRMDQVQLQALPLRTRGEEGEDGEHEWIEVDDATAAVVERSADEGLITERGVEDLLPGTEELAKIARGVAAKYLLDAGKIRTVAGNVTQLAGALGNEQASQQALARVEGALASTQVWTELVLLEIGVEILRFIGHKYIDSNEPWGGASLVNMGVGLLNTLETTVGNVAEAACGLVPEVGAAVCSVVRECVEIAYHNVGVVAAEQAAMKGLHLGYDQVVDTALRAMKQGHDPRTLRQQAGPLGALLDAFPTKEIVVALGDGKTKEMQEALFAYHDGVLALSRAAATAR